MRELLPYQIIQSPEKLKFNRRCPTCAALHDKDEIRLGHCIKCGVAFQEAKEEDLLPFVVITARGATHTVYARSIKQVEAALRSKGYRYESVKKGEKSDP